MNLLIAIFFILGSYVHLPMDKVEVMPEFNINFYLMGKDSIDPAILVQIGSNVEYLNQEFEDIIRFEIGQIFMDKNGAYIPDLHQDYIRRQSSRLKSLVLPIEVSGSINIYLFDTYVNEELGAAMMGFTPILTGRHHTYEFNSPRFDRVYIAYDGLRNNTTIVHEMGHFLGLEHPWEMTPTKLAFMGLTDVTTETNHMTYNPIVTSFTSEQLQRMHYFAIKFRNYLLVKS